MKVSLVISDTDPGLYSRILVSQETKIEVARFLAVQCEPIHTLCRISSKGVFEKEVFNMVRNESVKNSKAPTQFIFGTLLELLMGHQFFDPTSFCLHMINDQFVKIGISV